MRWKRVLLIVLGLFCLGVVIFLPFAGRALVINQQPKRSDAMIVLGGAVYPRVSKAVELYNDRYSPRLIMSGGNYFGMGMDEAQRMAQVAEENGVPSNAILLDTRSTSTYENAVFSKQIMIAHHFHSAIVVSSNYHMLRAAIVFDHVYHGSGIRLTYVAAPDRDFNPSHWWANDGSIHILESEYLEIGGTWLVFLFHLQPDKWLN